MKKALFLVLGTTLLMACGKKEAQSTLAPIEKAAKESAQEFPEYQTTYSCLAYLPGQTSQFLIASVLERGAEKKFLVQEIKYEETQKTSNTFLFEVVRTEDWADQAVRTILDNEAEQGAIRAVIFLDKNMLQLNVPYNGNKMTYIDCANHQIVNVQN